MSLRAESVILPAYAKINLFLDITGVLPNGYHTLNNIMQQINLHDKVTVSYSEGGTQRLIKITCDDKKVPCDEKNIAYRAARLYFERSGLFGSVNINIKKNIPVMAGLGGSSTDGAAVLSAMNMLCGNRFTRRELEEAGALLGADVPFCIRGNAALCKGIGEKMTDIEALADCQIVIIKPSFSCNTSSAYKLYDRKPIPAKGEPSKLLLKLKSGCVNDIGRELYNIFEPLYNDRRIEQIKKELIDAGAAGAALSGSGSSVYGIFDCREKAIGAVESLDYPFKIITNPISALEKK